MKKSAITFIFFSIALTNVLYSAEQQALPQWQKALFLSDYCFIADVVKHPDDGVHALKPREFFWGKHDEYIKARAKVADHPAFPLGSLFFVYYTLHPNGGGTTYYCRLKKSRNLEDTKMIINTNNKKMTIKDFRKLATERPRKK